MKLVPLMPWMYGQALPLNEVPVVLGRGETAHVQVQDRFASRLHCQIDMDPIDGSLLVRDLGSRHGTRVNGQTVSECTLHTGDQITIGVSTFIVAADSEALVSHEAF